MIMQGMLLERLVSEAPQGCHIMGGALGSITIDTIAPAAKPNLGALLHLPISAVNHQLAIFPANIAALGSSIRQADNCICMQVCKHNIGI